jgi:hypothetical protein
MVEPRDMLTSTIVGDAVRDYGVDYVYMYNEEFEWDCFKSDGTQINILDNVLN